MPKTETKSGFTPEEEKYIDLKVQQHINKKRDAQIQEEITRRINEYDSRN